MNKKITSSNFNAYPFYLLDLKAATKYTLLGKIPIFLFR